MGILPMNHGLEAHATLAVIHSYGIAASDETVCKEFTLTHR